MPAGRPRLPRAQLICKECGATFETRRHAHYCSRKCANRAVNRRSGMARTIRHPDDSRRTRGERESSAPGLTYTQRKELLARWRRQRRACAYCPAPATTLDHVLPLVRGGTNYEGNLAPACKSCNSSKSGWTVVEWRTGLRLAPMRRPPIYRAPTRSCDGCGTEYQPRNARHQYCKAECRPRVARPPRETRACQECGETTARPVYCSRVCSERYTARAAYRRRKGIPINAPLTGNGRPRTLTAIL